MTPEELTKLYKTGLMVGGHCYCQGCQEDIDGQRVYLVGGNYVCEGCATEHAEKIKPRHTPGPWHMEDNSHRDADGNLELCVLYVMGPESWVGGQFLAQVNGVSVGPAHEEALANAKLIAAAPEMLKALLIAGAHLETDLEDADAVHALEAVRAAIIEATGNEL